MWWDSWGGKLIMRIHVFKHSLFSSTTAKTWCSMFSRYLGRGDSHLSSSEPNPEIQLDLSKQLDHLGWLFQTKSAPGLCCFGKRQHQFPFQTLNQILGTNSSSWRALCPFSCSGMGTLRGEYWVTLAGGCQRPGMLGGTQLLDQHPTRQNSPVTQSAASSAQKAKSSRKRKNETSEVEDWWLLNRAEGWHHCTPLCSQTSGSVDL